MTERGNPSYLKVVAKTFRVIETLSHAKSGVPLSELARHVEQPKSNGWAFLSPEARLQKTLGKIALAVHDDLDAAKEWISERHNDFPADKIASLYEAIEQRRNDLEAAAETFGEREPGQDG